MRRILEADGTSLYGPAARDRLLRGWRSHPLWEEARATLPLSGYQDRLVFGVKPPSQALSRPPWLARAHQQGAKEACRLWFRHCRVSGGGGTRLNVTIQTLDPILRDC